MVGHSVLHLYTWTKFHLLVVLFFPPAFFLSQFEFCLEKAPSMSNAFYKTEWHKANK